MSSLRPSCARACLLVSLISAGAHLSHGQSTIVFEAASVTPAKGDRGFRGACRGIDSKFPPELLPSAPPIGRCVISNARFDQLIALAYQLRFIESIEGGPSWVRNNGVRFTVQAKAEDPGKTTEAQLNEMLKALINERFGAKIRVETRPTTGFALLVAKGGPKLAESGQDEREYFKVTGSHPATLTARKYTVQRLATFLELRKEQPVVDRTGLKGEYSFAISWDETNGPALVTALQELGLRLEAQKVPALFLVIESAHLPTAN